jgi:hypothetical protein
MLGCFAVGLHAQTLSVDKSSMSFSAQIGGGKVAQTLNVTSSSGATNFFATTNTSWLTVNPQTGTTPSAVTVTADPTGLSAGNFGGQITIFIGSTVAATVPVSLTVSSLAASPQSLQFTTTAGATPSALTVSL